MYTDLEFLQLQCNRQSDGGGGCNPYLWVVLLRIDDDTLASGQPVAAVYPADPTVSRLIVQPDMKAGDTAVLPDQIAHLAVHFRTDSVQKNLILIAALLDQHDTPGAAMDAGYQAFLAEAPLAVGSQLVELQTTDPAAKAAAIKAITDDINAKVTNAISAQLSWWDKLQIYLHLETPDRVIATAHQDWEGITTASAGSFILDFPSGTAPNLTDDFILSCQLLVNVDPCEAQVAAVEEIQQAIANIEGRAKELNSGQVHEPPAQIQTELDQLGKEMVAERAKLAAAELALKRCREGVVPPVPPVGPVQNAPG